MFIATGRMEDFSSRGKTHTHTHTNVHAGTHKHTHAHTHTHIHQLECRLQSPFLPPYSTTFLLTDQ